jgi:hypothetical protein
MPLPVDLVDAVVSLIQGGTYSQTVTTAKKLVPIYDRDVLTGWDVTVHSAEQSRELLSRSNLWTKIYTIGVVLRTDCSGTEAAQETKTGQFLTLCQELMDRLAANNLAGLYVHEIEQLEPFDPNRVAEDGVLQTTISIRYKGTI